MKLLVYGNQSVVRYTGAPAHATIPLRIRTRLQAALTEKQRGFKKEQL